MTADVELLPLPVVVTAWTRRLRALHGADCMEAEAIEAWFPDYARACVAHATAAKDAEIEALRAEVAKLDCANIAYSQQTALLIGRAGNAEAHAERLAVDGAQIREVEEEMHGLVIRAHPLQKGQRVRLVPEQGEGEGVARR